MKIWKTPCFSTVFSIGIPYRKSKHRKGKQRFSTASSTPTAAAEIILLITNDLSEVIK